MRMPEKAESPSRPPPNSEVKKHLDLALAFLEEGGSLARKNPAQASEKLYKAAEESVKLLAIHLGLTGALSRVGRRGRWAAADLEKAVEAISRKLGEWFRAAWDAA